MKTTRLNNNRKELLPTELPTEHQRLLQNRISRCKWTSPRQRSNNHGLLNLDLQRNPMVSPTAHQRALISALPPKHVLPNPPPFPLRTRQASYSNVAIHNAKAEDNINVRRQITLLLMIFISHRLFHGGSCACFLIFLVCLLSYFLERIL